MIKSLLLRDFIYLRNVIPLTLLISIGVALLVIFLGIGPLLILFLIFWISLSGLTTINHNDILSGMERRHRLLPVSDQALVISRFIFAFFLLSFSILYSLFLYTLFGSFYQSALSMEVADVLLTSLSWIFFFLLILIGIVLLVYYRFGYRWTKYVYFLIFFSSFLLIPIFNLIDVTAGGVFASFLTEIIAGLQWLSERPVLFFGFALFMYILCAGLSIRGYRKRISKL